MEFIKNHWEGIIALLALATSVVSVYSSFIGLKLQRTHNIKSVKPIIHVGQWDYENILFVTLKNCGSGLAVVKQMTVSNQTGEVKSWLYEWMPQKLPSNMNYKEYYTPYSEFVVQPGEIIKLIEIPVDVTVPEQVETREKLRQILGQLTIAVLYQDTYENEMPIKTMKLVHFLRKDNTNSSSLIFKMSEN